MARWPHQMTGLQAIWSSNVLAILRERNMTQLELAKKVPCHKQYLNWALTCNKPCSLKVCEQVGRALGVPPESLFIPRGDVARRPVMPVEPEEFEVEMPDLD